MNPLEKQMIEEEYTSKKPFTIILCFGIALAWLSVIFAITYIVNAVATFTINLF